MAFTKIAAAGIGSTGTVILEDIRANSLVVSGVSTLGSVVATTGTFSGNVSIAGTLTYEDVTNIDSIGVVTARSGVVVNTGTATTALVVNGNTRIVGILTIGTSSVTLDGTNNQVNVGTGVTIHHTNGVQVGGNTLHSSGLTVNSLNATGVITATSFRGDGSQLTGIAATTNVRTDSLVVSGVSTFINNPVLIGSATSTGTASQRLQVTGGVYISGNLGIGTINPNKEIHVYKGSGTTTLWLESGDTQKGIASISIDNNSYSFQSTYNTGGTAARPFVWYNVSTELMRLDATGKFGLGTASPSKKLDIYGSSNSDFSQMGLIGVSNAQNAPTLSTLDNNTTTNYGTFQLTSIFAGDTHVRSYWGVSVDINDGALGDSGSASQARIPSTSSFTVNSRSSSTAFNTLFAVRNSGNIGIGTNSPRTKLDIDNGKLLVVQSGTPTGTYNYGVNTHVASGAGGMQVTSGSSYSYFVGNSTDIILGSDVGSTGIKVQVSRTCGDNSLVITSSGQVVANYNSTTGVVNSFGHGGYYGLSANSNSTALADQRCSWFLRGSLEGTNNELGNSVLLIQNTGGAAINIGDLIKGYRGSSFIFRVAGGDGSVRNSSGSYAALSDERIKQDIVDAESQWNDIKSVRVRKFKLKENVETYGESAPTFIGVIAQELEQVSPGLVDQAKLEDGSSDPESIKSVKYSILYMKSVKALQEAQQRIETLESQVSLLVRKVEELENKII